MTGHERGRIYSQPNEDNLDSFYHWFKVLSTLRSDFFHWPPLPKYTPTYCKLIRPCMTYHAFPHTYFSNYNSNK